MTQETHEEKSAENKQEGTREWVQRTFFEEHSKIGGPGGEIRAEKCHERWRAVELLNKVERNKLRTKVVSSGYLKAASTPPNLKDYLSCNGQQNVSINIPHISQASFSKGVIQFGPSEIGETRTKTGNPSLRKESDQQKNAIKWATEPGKNMKTKSLWVQRFFRNPHRKPFQWRSKTCGEERKKVERKFKKRGLT